MQEEKRRAYEEEPSDRFRQRKGQTDILAVKLLLISHTPLRNIHYPLTNLVNRRRLLKD